MHLTRYRDDQRHLWDEFLQHAHAGSILQSRRFLDYHGDRFTDESICIWSDPGIRLKAVLPLARSPYDPELVVSHPGITFGGLIADAIDPAERLEMMAAAARYLMERGYRKLSYRLMPAIFGGQFDESDLRLFLANGLPSRTDLWSFIRLDRPFSQSAKRRASIKAAGRKGVVARQAETDADWAAFHAMLAGNLADRHDAAPVHTLADLLDLKQRLGASSRLWLGCNGDGAIVAGSWCLAYNDDTLHTQYIASTPEGRNIGAVDYVLSEIVDTAPADGFRIMSFGISTREDGFQVNTNLLKQKLRFGAGVTIQWRFDIELERLSTMDGGFA